MTARGWPEQVALRQQVRARDSHRCQYPRFRGCEQTSEVCGSGALLEVHHVLPRGRGGKHEAGNLITLCKQHHRDKLLTSVDWTRYDFQRGGWK